MKRFALFLLAATLSHATTMEDYWQQVAYYHAQNAAFEKSLTSEQRAMQEKMTEINKAIAALIEKRTKECNAEGGVLKVAATTVTCDTTKRDGETKDEK